MGRPELSKDKAEAARRLLELSTKCDFTISQPILVLNPFMMLK